ncbi:MAG: glycosyltransferase [Muribaculaceae bacterium]|nr:glycosyltransferase [Muribaculaceae bacterium]
MNGILLSFIIPLYNTETFIIRCLQSIIDQGFNSDEYEVIVVDDGSTDGGKGIVQSFAAQHPQVRLICQQNAGVSAARNVAIDAARGRYIQFVDSDDYLVEGMMPPLLNRAMDESLDVLEFNYDCVDIKGQPIPHVRDDNYPSTVVMTGVDYLGNHSMTPYVWRFLIRRDYLVRGGWRFNPSLIVCEDGALIADFMLNAARVAHDETASYCYVNRGDSAMHNPDRDHLRRRIFSQVDAAVSIDKSISAFQAASGKQAPPSVAGVRNVYLYFSMTKALTCGLVDEVLDRIRQAGLYPFPCVGPEANYYGIKWKVIHWVMMRPRLWAFLSKIYRMIKK